MGGTSYFIISLTCVCSPLPPPVVSSWPEPPSAGCPLASRVPCYALYTAARSAAARLTGPSARPGRLPTVAVPPYPYARTDHPAPTRPATQKWLRPSQRAAAARPGSAEEEKGKLNWSFIVIAYYV